MLRELLRSILMGAFGASQDLPGNPSTLTIPGSSVRKDDLRALLDRTMNAAEGLCELSNLHGERLAMSLPKTLLITSVSEALDRLDSEGILDALMVAKAGASVLQAQFPDRAEELRKLEGTLSKLRRDWTDLLGKDFSQEEEAFEFTVRIRGPKTKLAAFEAELQSAVDDATLKAIIHLRLGISPECGHLLILDEERPQHVGTSLQGDALRNRIEQLGGIVVPDEEVEAFKSKIKLKAFTEGLFDDEDDLDDDGDDDDDDEEVDEFDAEEDLSGERVAY